MATTLSRLIEPLPGFTPEVGKLVGMMTYVRGTTLAAARGLTTSALDRLQDGQSNSIGSLLAHIAAVESYYQTVSFEGRPGRGDEGDAFRAALELGDLARQSLKGQPLEHYLAELERVRARTLDELSRKDDVWLGETKQLGKHVVNQEWMWFHVFEDEVNHRGQIRWLRKRLPE